MWLISASTSACLGYYVPEHASQQVKEEWVGFSSQGNGWGLASYLYTLFFAFLPPHEKSGPGEEAKVEFCFMIVTKRDGLIIQSCWFSYVHTLQRC